MRGLYSIQGEAIYMAPWLDPKIGTYTSCIYREGESGWAKDHERRRNCIYQPQVVWICHWEEHRRETTMDVTLQTSFGSAEILEFEYTVVADIFSYEHIGNRTLTPPTPADLESSIIWLNSCNYMYNIAT